MPKASGLTIVGSAVSWHLAAARVSLGVPPEKGGAGLENPSEYPVLYACQSASSSDGAGWQSVRVPWRAVRGGLRARRLGYSPVFETRTVRRLYRWRCYLSCTEHCHEHIGLPFPARAVRSGQLFRSLHAQYDPDNAEPERPPSVDPNAFVATLHRIEPGAAADGQPWPERHQLPGRCLQLADADCALAGLRVVAELMLAAERTRQNGAPEEYLGDRVMEGLKMACVALTAQVTERLQVRE